MKDLKIVLDHLNAAHTAKDRDANLVAALFTMAQNLGGKLKAYEYSATSGHIARVWDAQKAHR
jgi:hypothetical protein